MTVDNAAAIRHSPPDIQTNPRKIVQMLEKYLVAPLLAATATGFYLLEKVNIRTMDLVWRPFLAYCRAGKHVNSQNMFVQPVKV